MDNDEFRTVRVYTKKYTSKDKNGNSVEKESKQKQVSLKKEDPFEDDDLVKVLSQKEYSDLIDKQVSDDKLKEYDEIIKQKDEEIAELNNQIKEINDERVAIFKELDYKNKMILAYNVELNKSILNAINVVIDEARDNINKRNATLIDDLNKSVEKARSDVNEKNKAIAYDINSTVEDMNEQIRNTSTLKMLLNKKKINLRVPTEDLLKPFEFDFDVDKLISGQALELDAAEILKEVMPKLPEPFSKYIDTLDEEPETIDVSSKKEE